VPGKALDVQTPRYQVILTYDLFLLHRKGKSLQTRIFSFEDGCIKAIVVLNDAALAQSSSPESHQTSTYKVNDHSILLSRRDFSRFHLFRMSIVATCK
jgi:hypothetical protein